MTLKSTIKILWVVVGFFSFLGFILFIFTIFNGAYFNTSFQIDTELASKFGNFFGGFIGTLFAITSTLLILVTLLQQNIDNKKSQTGGNFFKMLDYHTENVKQLCISHIDPDKKEDKIEGRRAFVIFKLQLIELCKVVNKIKKELQLGLSNEEIIDIVYIAFYYGIDKDWEKFAENKLSRYQKGKEIAKLLLDAKNSDSKNIGRTNQTSLSSYFRNLYNAVKLIDNDKNLTLDEKKQYIKILRAQLSNPELYVFFFNIVSRFGKKWKENGYIDTYELIKNIPLDYLGNYNPKDFFLITYEEDEINKFC
ncbi:MAG: putative phage abortive infection protein [Ignavibacteriaceae bacterium]|nr:putative phage abortive infection protein [Ignavibacteriaceae bacterium]